MSTASTDDCIDTFSVLTYEHRSDDADVRLIFPITTREQMHIVAVLNAAQNGDTHNLARLLSESSTSVGASYEDRQDALNANCWSAVLLAAKNGHADCLRLLIDGGANVNAVNTLSFSRSSVYSG
jgi:ankyrin repeat protein